MRKLDGMYSGSNRNPFSRGWMDRVLLLAMLALIPACLTDAAVAAGVRANPFFEEYKGQFLVRTASHSVRIASEGATFYDRDSTIHMNLAGADSNALPELEKRDARVNYFIGSDPDRWRRGVATYSRVTYRNVYPGIDVTYYAKDGELEFDLIVGPQGVPSLIRLTFVGATKLSLDENGGLKVRVLSSVLSIGCPIAYQVVNGAKRPVGTAFELVGQSEAVLRIKTYDSHLPLIIDPILTYSTYIGGSQLDTVAGIATDSAGNAYIVGQTQSIDFPVEFPIQSLRGPSDAFITKLDPNGNPVYSTFIGGDADDAAKAIAVDSAGNAYIAGSTFSQNFPTAGPTKTQYGGAGDGFITRLDASGSLSLSMYLSGDASDIATGIAVDGAGNIYVTGSTKSTNFPIPWFPRNLNDAYVAKFDSTGVLTWGKLLGGSGEDTGSGIAIDQSGFVYLTGTTASSDFGTVLPLQPKISGPSDCFVAITTNQGVFIYSSYLGGSGNETCTAITVDASGITIVGGTDSSDFPTLRPIQPMLQGATDGFVTKLALDGSRLVYSTYLGGGNDDILNDVTADGSGTVYVVGRTFSTDLQLINPIQTSNLGGADVMVAKISPSETLTFSTYLGGGGDDTGVGVALDSTGNLLLAGNTLSPDFPTQQAFQPSIRGNLDGFAAKIPVDQLRPRNDDFKNAIVLAGVSGATDGNNLGATLEAGETPVGHGGGASVWWRWTAPFSGTATFDTIGSNFETVLGVFKGTNVGSLILVGYDEASGGGGTSLLSFQVVGGTTYQISVNGYSTETGNIHLDWQLRAPVVSAASVAITGLQPVLTPNQQQMVGITLTSSYPLPLTGRLTLTFLPDPAVNVDDPAIQFSNGSRSVDFSLPVNNVNAVFSDGSNAVAVQSGTVAGTITITMSLSASNVDVSPSPPPGITAVVGIAPPTITNVTVTSVTNTTFQVVIDGFSTARSVSSAAFVFFPAAGRRTQTSNLTVDFGALLTNWFQTAESMQAGSRFRLVVPFVMSQGRVSDLSGFSVALTNQIGNSSAGTLPLP
jgi:hypothetical protein